MTRLPDTRKRIIIVACGNDDFFHGENRYHPRYLIFGKLMIDDPTREQICKLLSKYPESPIMMVVAPCYACQLKGIRGPTLGFTIQREANDADS